MEPQTDLLPVVGPVGVEAVALDLHAPRAASPPVGAHDADSTRVQYQSPQTPAAAGRAPAPATGVATPGNRAAAIAVPLQNLLRSLQQIGVGDDPAVVLQPVSWPADAMAVATDPVTALQELRQALGQSPWFAANPRTPAALAGATPRASGTGLPAQDSSDAAASAGNSAPREGQGSPQVASFAERSTVVLPTAQDSANAVTADGVQQALQLLLHGQLRWSGELTPGVRCKLQREDVWEEDPQHPGRLLPGTLIRVVLDLPGTGALEVQAQQVGERLRVRLLPAAGRAHCFEDALTDLRTALVPLVPQPVDLVLLGRAESGA